MNSIETLANDIAFLPEDELVNLVTELVRFYRPTANKLEFLTEVLIQEADYMGTLQ